MLSLYMCRAISQTFTHHYFDFTVPAGINLAVSGSTPHLKINSGILFNNKKFSCASIRLLKGLYILDFGVYPRPLYI